MPPKIPDDLKEVVGKAFVEYERVFIERIVRKPGWRLAADHFESVLATEDEARIRAYIDDLNASRRDLESGVIVNRKPTLRCTATRP